MRSFFIFFDKCVSTLWLRKAYAVLWAANCFLGSKTPKHNAFDQFWKIKFHFEDFPRNTQFLSFDGPNNYLCIFKNHRQTFSWPGERPSSHLKVTKTWFGPNRKYLLELGCRELIFCYVWFYYHFCNEICTHSIYSIINYRIVIRTSAILEKKFINNLELFQIKNVSGFCPKYCEWYSVWGFHEWTVENMKILWSYFWLCFSFSCFVYNLAVIKKSHTLNWYSFLRKFLSKTQI